MAKKIATLGGTFLVPGKSKNNRLYTAENIKSAVESLNLKAASGKPATVAAGHLDRTMPERVIGHITSAEQKPDGSALFEAHIFDTQIGRDMAAVSGPDGALRAVSIHGFWTGGVTQESGADTAPGLDLDGIDIVVNPGIESALISNLSLAESSDGRKELRESAEAEISPISPDAVTQTEETEAEAAKPFISLAAALAEASAHVSMHNGMATFSGDAYHRDPEMVKGMLGKLHAAVSGAMDTMPDPTKSNDQMESASAGTKTTKEPAVTLEDKTTKTAVTEDVKPGATALSEDDRTTIISGVAAALKESVTASEASVATKVTAAVEAATTTVREELKKELAEEFRTEMLRAYGTPKRAGLIAAAESTDAPTPEQLAAMSRTDFNAHASAAFDQVFADLGR